MVRRENKRGCYFTLRICRICRKTSSAITSVLSDECEEGLYLGNGIDGLSSDGYDSPLTVLPSSPKARGSVCFQGETALIKRLAASLKTDGQLEEPTRFELVSPRYEPGLCPV